MDSVDRFRTGRGLSLVFGFTLHPAYDSVVSALGGTTTTLSAAARTTSSATATTMASGIVAKWRQCGGTGWTGGTVSVAGRFVPTLMPGIASDYRLEVSESGR